VGKVESERRVWNVESENTRGWKVEPERRVWKGESDKASLKKSEIGRVNEKKLVCSFPCGKRENVDDGKEDIILFI